MAIDPDNISQYGSIVLTDYDMRNMLIPKLTTKGEKLTFIIRRRFAKLFHLENKQIVYICATLVNDDVGEYSGCHYSAVSNIDNIC